MIYIRLQWSPNSMVNAYHEVFKILGQPGGSCPDFDEPTQTGEETANPKT
jgi:hypothetical protein